MLVDTMMLIVLLRKRGEEGKELKTPRYTSAAAIRDYIIICDIIPNSKTNCISRALKLVILHSKSKSFQL